MHMTCAVCTLHKYSSGFQQRLTNMRCGMRKVISIHEEHVEHASLVAVQWPRPATSWVAIENILRSSSSGSGCQPPTLKAIRKMPAWTLVSIHPHLIILTNIWGPIHCATIKVVPHLASNLAEQNACCCQFLHAHQRAYAGKHLHNCTKQMGWPTCAKCPAHPRMTPYTCVRMKRGLLVPLTFSGLTSPQASRTTSSHDD